MNWRWINFDRLLSARRLFMRPECGFSLVELMITICILAVGIVGVLRSFLSSSAVLDQLNNRVSALMILDRKIAALDETGLDDQDSREETEVVVGSRKAVFRRDAGAWRKDGQETPFNNILMSVVWKEGAVVRDESVEYLVGEKI